MPWWPSCLDRGAIINVDPQDVKRWFEARRDTGSILGDSCTQRFLSRTCQLLVAYTSLYRVLIKRGHPRITARFTEEGP